MLLFKVFLNIADIKDRTDDENDDIYCERSKYSHSNGELFCLTGCYKWL